jgi:hypothetical protein
MGFNLLFPWVGLNQTVAPLLEALELTPAPLTAWEFEHVVDAHEGTNLDFHLRFVTGAEVHVEVKLCETAFGRAKADAPHREKVGRIYRPRLVDCLRQGLEDDRILQHYQLLRLVSGLDVARGDQLRLIVPRANEALRPGLEFLDNVLVPASAARVQVVYLEDLVAKLRVHPAAARLATHLDLFAEKYLLL